MKPVYRFIAIALSALALFAWWYYQPKRVLERRLDSLISDLSISADTSRTARLIKSSSISQYFDQQVEIASPMQEANGNFSPDEINGSYSFLAENAREIFIKRDPLLATTIDGIHATQQFEADINVAISRWHKGMNGRYSITVHWRKTDKGWLIHSSNWFAVL